MIRDLETMLNTSVLPRNNRTLEVERGGERRDGERNRFRQPCTPLTSSRRKNRKNEAKSRLEETHFHCGSANELGSPVKELSPFIANCSGTALRSDAFPELVKPLLGRHCQPLGFIPAATASKMSDAEGRTRRHAPVRHAAARVETQGCRAHRIAACNTATRRYYLSIWRASGESSLGADFYRRLAAQFRECESSRGSHGYGPSGSGGRKEFRSVSSPIVSDIARTPGYERIARSERSTRLSNERTSRSRMRDEASRCLRALSRRDRYSSAGYRYQIPAGPPPPPPPPLGNPPRLSVLVASQASLLASGFCV
ncbi:hypothetical protein WN48_05725 [Eufriesea mexicana]|nr:hypothetical protein WN48_05725 [Eufriesea mexicana]